MQRVEYEAALLNHGAYVLGSGYYGTVYGHDSAGDRCIKVSRGGDTSGEVYHQWAAQNGWAGNFAPVVDSFTHHNQPGSHEHFWVMSMERLDKTASRLKANQGFSHVDHCLTDRENNWPAAWDFCEAQWPGFNAFTTIAREAGFGFDWSMTNWMLNKDCSRIVLTDPQCWESMREDGPSVKARRWRVRQSGKIVIITTRGV